MKHIMYRFTAVLISGFILLNISSCKKYLDVRPDKKLVIPKSLNDCQALLDDYQSMNALYPSDAELAADNYFMLADDWLSLNNQQDRDTYVWNAQGEHLITQWLYPYQVVYNANLVLQTLNSVHPAVSEQERWNALKGAALFFRAYAFYQVAQLFAAPYHPGTAAQLPGIPIRLSPDLALKSERGNLKQVYDQVITDLRQAASLLPVNTSFPSRPSKTAAYAALARTYLTMQDYEQAGSMATACLNLNNYLMDYNTIAVDSETPFKQFNKEVIFQALSAPNDALYPGPAKINTELLESYASNDLRRKAFFTDNGDATFSFKGSYDGDPSSTGFFGGLATDEVYLIRAECFARAGNTDPALADLNALLQNRIEKDTYIPVAANSAEITLRIILEERRKELLFRNIRWTDLRRLNQDPRFAVTLERKLTVAGVETTYELLPNDLKYTFLIPQNVIDNSSMIQNPRILIK